MFKDSFKFYKSRAPPPDLSDVIDLEKHHLHNVKRVRINSHGESLPDENLGLNSLGNWQIFEFPDIPGLIFVRNPFTAHGQRFWITKCLRDYSREPNKLNIDAHGFMKDGENWWDICTRNTERAKELESKLRWATLGYHHNWDTKLYSEDSRDDMPKELTEMTLAFAKALGFVEFKPQAAIINYYRMNSTLAGHTDHSEVDLRAPLFSISFGQSAIFLIGGLTQEEPANALFLRSGDVVVMTGESRLRYHGVPKILTSDNSPWDSENPTENESSDFGDREDWKKARDLVSGARININVRQVLKRGQTSL